MLGPILHWVQPGLHASAASSASSHVLLEASPAAEAPVIANYIGPAPPPGSAPHRYAFFLYEQPEGFEGRTFAPKDGKTLGIFDRMRASLDDWVKKLGLGEVLAVNYFNSN